MRLVFAGTTSQAATVLQRLHREHEVVLVITREDAPFGRKRELKPSDVALAAEALNLPVLKRNRLLAQDVPQISDVSGELAVVVAYGALIPQSLLDLMPWWNLHYSLLPKLRGAAPLQHSMLQGGKHSGITLFQLDRGMDTGPILAQIELDIDFTKTYGQHLDSFTQKGAELVSTCLKNPPEAKPQQGTSSLAPKLTRADARLNFSNAAEQLLWKIMGINPEPMAWAETKNGPIRISKASLTTAASSRKLGVGEVDLQDGCVVVLCGDGNLLQLLEVQPAGKNLMDAAAWFRGQNQGVSFE